MQGSDKHDSSEVQSSGQPAKYIQRMELMRKESDRETPEPNRTGTWKARVTNYN